MNKRKLLSTPETDGGPIRYRNSAIQPYNKYTGYGGAKKPYDVNALHGIDNTLVAPKRKLMNSFEKKDKDLSFVDYAVNEYSNKRGLDFKTLNDSFNDQAKWTAGVESSLNNNLRPDIKDNTSRGYFQFNDASIKTVKTRISNTADRYGKKIPEELKDFMSGKKDIIDLPYETQADIYKINMLEDSLSNVGSIIDRDMDKYINLYATHHRDKKVIAFLKESGIVDFSLADDKGILSNINRVNDKVDGFDYSIVDPY